MKINFASDNLASVHPNVLNKIIEVNSGPALAYGADEWTKIINLKFKKLFGVECESFLVWNGTSANVLSLSSLISSYQSILCADVSHLWTSECGAVEKMSSGRLVPIKTKDGKLTVELLKDCLIVKGDVHSSQPKVLSLTLPNEYGVFYSLGELKALSDFSKKNDLYLQIDGARIANYFAKTKIDPKEWFEAIKPDLLSFGGTKNGLMGVEAIISFNSKMNDKLPFIRKQGLHLASKMRYLSAQFLAYFENDLWLSLATHANEMALQLSKKLSPIVKISHPVDANMVFVQWPKELNQKLSEEFLFYVWDESSNEVRLVCSFDTTVSEVDALSNKLIQLIG
jgi:threonine aldolase